MDQLYSKKVDKGLWFLFTQKVCVHNRVPSKQLHYWGSGSLMGYFLEKLFGCCFFSKGLIRHHFLGGNLAFWGFQSNIAFQSKWTSFTQRRWIKGCVFLHPKKFVCTIEYHPNNYIIEDLGHSWGTSFKNCLGAVFLNKGLIRHLFFGRNLAFWGFQSNMAF